MPILSHHPAHERDHTPAVSVAFVVSPACAAPCPGCGCAPVTCESGGCGCGCCCSDAYPLPAAALADEQGARELWFAGKLAADDGNPNQELGRLVVTDSRGADDFATFVERMSSRRAVVLVDEVAEFYDRAVDRRAAVLAQRAELHFDLSDDLLGDLAARAVYRRPLWRRLAALVGGAR